MLVYTKELKQTRLITAHGDGSQGFRRFGISCDSDSNVYVGDPSGGFIHVYNAGGAFLRSFPVSSWPWSVCVSGQYVYVSNNNGHNVLVFTTGGEHVATFGQKGSRYGDFNRPFGVCVDGDGFVYVCDECNNRVQIF